MGKRIKEYKNLFLLLAVAAAVVLIKNLDREALLAVFGAKEERSRVTVVIDAGHGGIDPGKVGVAGTQEKIINLEIAYRLKRLLEQNDIRVVLTREGDGGLYSESDSNKKSADMRKRIAILTEEAPALAVSIHQNSFTSAGCKGAQVFFFEGSKEGEALAKTLQQAIKETVADGNTREAKANGSYYMLKKSPCTFAIIECGFLSNPEEEALLLTEEYQEKMAWAIHLGILRYLNAQEEDG